MFTIKDVIDIAVQIERNGEHVYRSAAEKIKNPELASLLKWLADEESAHADLFETLKKDAPEAIADPQLEKMGKDILLDALGKQSFSLGDADFKESQSLRDLMALAIEFEKDTVLFYEMLRPFISGKDAGADLDEIISEENKHIEKMTFFLVNGRLPAQ